MGRPYEGGHGAANKRWLATRPDYYKDRRQTIKAEVDELKLFLGCADCGYRERACALDFDHTSDDKMANVARLITNSTRARVFQEIDKCEVVCANCHRGRTEDRRLEVS
jgi:hypothetical protein